MTKNIRITIKNMDYDIKNMDIKIQPLNINIKIMRESNPLKSRILVRRLAVPYGQFS